MPRFPRINTKEQLCALINDLGFLPLFPSVLPGFSVMDVTDPDSWWNEDAMENSPWNWRMDIAAQGKIAYGKFFGGKAGYISLDWFPVFANHRRNGYDFDSLWDEGKAPYRHKLIMDLFTGDEKLISFDIKRKAGFGKDGQKGYEGAVAALMTETYLVINGFTRKLNKRGEEYGWHVGLHCTPESCFGPELVRARYAEEPAASKSDIIARCRDLVPDADEADILRFVG